MEFDIFRRTMFSISGNNINTKVLCATAVMTESDCMWIWKIVRNGLNPICYIDFIRRTRTFSIDIFRDILVYYPSRFFKKKDRVDVLAECILHEYLPGVKIYLKECDAVDVKNYRFYHYVGGYLTSEDLVAFTSAKSANFGEKIKEIIFKYWETHFIHP